MNLAPSARQRATQDALRELLRAECPISRVRAAEPLGFDADLWRSVRDTLALEASRLDLALAAEALGAHLAPVPLAEASASASAVAGVDRGIPAGALVAFALAGERLVPAGAVADAVVGMRADALVVATGDPPGRAPANLACTPIADRELASGDVVAVGDDARERYATGRAVWQLCTAGLLVGLAQRALDLTVAWVRERHQFGVPIGSFQAVQHRLADIATSVDGARLLVWRAAWAGDEREPDAGAWAMKAFLFATETARASTAAAVQFHGGRGYVLDCDVQLFHRRAQGWPLLLGDPADEWRRLGDRLFACEPSAETADVHAHRPQSPAVDDGIDFRLGASHESVRTDVRAFLAEHLTAEVIERVHRTGTVHDWGFHRALAATGWLGAGWPREHGGAGRDPWELRVFAEECALADAPTDGLSMTMMVANTLRVAGTEEQRRTILPRVLAGDELICLGYSEPDAGSDVANAQTTAVRDGDGWLINGEKVFTSLAHEAQHVFLLTRTNAGGSKHRGLTMFLVPMDTPGIRVEPIWTLGAPGRTNRTHYEDVRVDDACRVGDVDEGWSVMNIALTFERGGTFAALRALRETVAWARANGRIAEPAVATRLARVATENDVATLLSIRTTWVAACGELPGIEGSMAKLFASESLQRSTADLLDLLGTDGLLLESEPGAPAGGALEYQWRKAAVATIYGGTSEILRGIVAERGLGLPRSRRAA